MPKKIVKRKPKKVKKRKPKKVKKRRRRKFGMTVSSDDEDDNDNNNVGKKKSLRTGYVDTKTYPRKGALGPIGDIWGTGTGFTADQTKTNKFVDITLKRLGITYDPDRKKQYSVKMNTLGTFKIDGGKYTGFEIKKFYENITTTFMPLTRLAKYQPVHNIIQLVFLTQIFVIDKLRNPENKKRRLRKDSKLLKAVTMLQESAKPFRNINLLLKDIARETKDDRIVQAVGKYFPKSGGLRSVAFEDQDGNIVFDKLSLKKRLNPRLLKHKDFDEYIAETGAEFKHFYEDAKDNVSENAKTVEWNMVKDFIDDVKEYLIGEDGMSSLFSEELEVYHLKTVAKLPSEEIKVDTLATKGKGGKTLLKREVKTKKKGKKSSKKELVLVEKEGTVENLTKSMSNMSVGGSLKSILKTTAGVDLDIPPRKKTLEDLVFERNRGRRRRKKTASRGVRLTPEKERENLFTKLGLTKDDLPNVFGKRKRKVSKKKGPSSALKKLCKRLKVKLTVKRGKKRVYKSEKVLKGQCRKASKAKLKKRRKSKFGG